jgi:hypothetical protein
MLDDVLAPMMEGMESVISKIEQVALHSGRVRSAEESK